MFSRSCQTSLTNSILRYLIANVMQNFSSLPLTTQSTFNPLSNPTLMATLLVPQLEAYLASNASTRLLILQYSSTHLATVLALRNLLGVDILKVAGILDSLASDLPSILSSPRTPRSSMSNPLSNEAVSSRLSYHDRREPEKSLDRPKPSERKVRQRPSIAASMADSVRSRSSIVLPKIDTSGSASFSKANFLLPSTATDTEITTFLSGIWKSLMEKSIFYTPEPEPEPEPIVIEKIVQAPVVPNLPTPITPTDYRSRDAAFPPVSFRPSGHQSKISRLTGSVKHGYAPSLTTSTKHGYTPSIASTVKTKGTAASRREEREWENFYIAEEDSDDDAYDKMTLGREFARIMPEVRKPVGAGSRRPTKKALKWLGLA